MKSLKKNAVKLLVLMLLVALGVSSVTVATAREPYASYYITDSGTAMKIPAPYEVVTVIDFKSTEEGRLNGPEDMFIGSDDKIYVVDSGNNRIVVINPANEDGEYTLNNIIQGTSIYAEGDMSALKDPRGIYVDEDGTILVADYGNKRLVEYTKYGNFKYSYSTPDSELLSSTFNYMPLKVTKDSRGYIYVANAADSNGILMLDEDGSFRQYYGANKVTLTFWESLSRVLWDRESRKGSIVTLPYSFNNIFASADGYIYATTTTTTPPQVRKINAGGSDVIYSSYDFADTSVTKSKTGTKGTAQIFCDVTVDAHNNMLILDQTYGRIYEYDANGVNLFAFSTNGSGYGQLSYPVAIETDSQGRLYVLNKNTGTITVFKTTEFADLIHQANDLYANGKYDEAFPIWQKVLDKDSYYTLALQNMGLIYMREDEYDKAYEYFYNAEDATNASDAFVEQRANFLRDYFAIIVSVVVVLLIGLVILVTILRKKKKKKGNIPEKRTFFTPVKDFWKRIKGVIRHPIDTFECIRYEDQGSYGDMAIIMILYLVLSVGSAYLKSFVYRGGEPLEFVQPVTIALTAILPWFVICFVNYGVTAIMYGEGRFRDIFIGGAYCHVPLMLLTLPMAAITNVLSLDEATLYNLVQYIIYAWVVILAYLCIKSIHGFHPIKGIVVFFITLVGVAAVILLFMIVYGLAAQLISFIAQFGKELSYLG